MANRIVLNETSYHGAGAINEIPGEVTKRGFHKAFVASDPDLVKFGVTAKVTKILEENGMDYEVYSNIKPVSYTHLEVYKRQDKGSEILLFPQGSASALLSVLFSF